jgi:hypothetical protein
LPSGVVMSYRHLLVVRAFRAGEVPGAAGRVGGDDGSLVVIVNVAALLALLAVGDHRTPLVYHYPARNLYCQRATSVRDTPACRFDSTASRAGTGVSCSPQAWLLLEFTKPVLISVTFGNREAALDLAVLVFESGGVVSLILTSLTSRDPKSHFPREAGREEMRLEVVRGRASSEGARRSQEEIT